MDFFGGMLKFFKDMNFVSLKVLISFRFERAGVYTDYMGLQGSHTPLLLNTKGANLKFDF